MLLYQYWSRVVLFAVNGDKPYMNVDELNGHGSYDDASSGKSPSPSRSTPSLSPNIPSKNPSPPGLQTSSGKSILLVHPAMCPNLPQVESLPSGA